MLRIILSVLFCVLLSSLSASAQANLLKQLIDLPAPAPIVRQAAERRERESEFYAWKNIPPDDAPIEDLIDYWMLQARNDPQQMGYAPKASDESAKRLLDYFEDNPAELFQHLNALPPKPEIVERVKNIYGKLTTDPVLSSTHQTSQVKNWLKYNSKDFSGDLAKEVRKIKDQNDYVSNENQNALRSLARVDWDTAQQYVERMESDSTQPYTQILAFWAHYQHGIDTNDASETEKYRDKLKAVVKDKTAAWAKRDLAMDALVAGGNWDGRDEWYFSLLGDETLLTIQDNGNTGLTTMVNAMPPETYRERLLSLVKSDNLAVRSAAARNLTDIFTDEKEILQALLPWLSDENWAKESRDGERGTLIANLGKVSLPESVPMLITVLSNEEDKLFAAATALAFYADSRALPALKAALKEEMSEEQRKSLIEAIIACGGYSDDEQMSALEAYATLVSTPEGEQILQEFQYNYEPEIYDSDEESGEDEEESPKPVRKPKAKPKEKLLPVQISIGKYVAEQTEPGEGLVTRAIERLKILKQRNPPIAVKLEEVMKKWQGRAIFIETLRQIRSGEATLETILNALTKRKEMREKVPNYVLEMRGASGLTRGIGACLAEDETDYLGILGQMDADAQVAMLGCARLLRAKLPVEEVGAFLNNPNKLVALAAERWLESEDSVRARTLVLAKHPNEAKILGARYSFVPDEKNVQQSEGLYSLFQSVNGSFAFTGEFPNLNKISDTLRTEIKDNADMLAVYSVLPNSEHGQHVLRVYKDRVQYTFYEDAARFWERNLTKEEYEAFYNSLLSEKIDSLTPTLQNCHHGCPSGEFVMFGRGGGRRVFYSGYNLPGGLTKIGEFFEMFRKDAKLRYRLADKIKGLEVISADDNFPVHTVWKKDGVLSFVVEDKLQQQENQKAFEQMNVNETEVEDETDEQRAARYQAHRKRREEMEFAHFSWRKLENGKPGGIADQPFEAQFLYDGSQVSKNSEFTEFPRAWQVRTRGGEIRVTSYYGEDTGLFRAAPGQTPVKIRAGKYLYPIASPDGKWAVVSKSGKNWSEPKTAVRVNLQTNAELKINLAPADTFAPIAFLPTHNKFLLMRRRGNLNPNQITMETDAPNPEVVNEATDKNSPPNPSPKTPEYYLLDAATGATQIVKGEFRPLLQQTFRALQPTGNPNEFWAAIYDAKTKTTDIGRYNDKTFSFQPITKLPEIALDSMGIYVDEKENKVYFVYQGHLLSVKMAEVLMQQAETRPQGSVPIK